MEVLYSPDWAASLAHVDCQIILHNYTAVWFWLSRMYWTRMSGGCSISHSRVWDEAEQIDLTSSPAFQVAALPPTKKSGHAQEGFRSSGTRPPMYGSKRLCMTHALTVMTRRGARMWILILMENCNCLPCSNWVDFIRCEDDKPNWSQASKKKHASTGKRFMSGIMIERSKRNQLTMWRNSGPETVLRFSKSKANSSSTNHYTQRLNMTYFGKMYVQ